MKTHSSSFSVACAVRTAACALWIQGCSPATLATDDIGPAGGVLVELETGASLVIPAGALADETKLSFTRLGSQSGGLPDGSIALSAPVALSPSETSLARAATLTLTVDHDLDFELDDAKLLGSLAVLRRDNAEDPSWEAVPIAGIDASSYSLEIVVRTDRLGVYVVTTVPNAVRSEAVVGEQVVSFPHDLSNSLYGARPVMAKSGDYLYWSSSAKLQRLKLEGSAAIAVQTLFEEPQGRPLRLVALGADAVYFAHSSSDGGHSWLGRALNLDEPRPTIQTSWKSLDEFNVGVSEASPMGLVVGNYLYSGGSQRLDLSSGAVEPIPPPLDTASLGWDCSVAPDRTRFLCLDREIDMSRPSSPVVRQVLSSDVLDAGRVTGSNDTHWFYTKQTRLNGPQTVYRVPHGGGDALVAYPGLGGSVSPLLVPESNTLFVWENANELSWVDFESGVINTRAGLRRRDDGKIVLDPSNSHADGSVLWAHTRGDVAFLMTATSSISAPLADEIRLLRFSLPLLR